MELRKNSKKNEDDIRSSVASKFTLCNEDKRSGNNESKIEYLRKKIDKEIEKNRKIMA